MSSSRRGFIKRFGIALAGLMCTGCRLPIGPTCYMPVQPTNMPPDSGSSTHSPALSPEHERLRACWLALDALAEQTQEDSERGQQTRQDLVAEHRAALDALVRSGVLSVPVGEQIQLAFEQAADHIWSSYAPITCYRVSEPNYFPASCDELVRQAELLAEGEDLDPETVALAQAAIARDMAFLGRPPEEINALYAEIRQSAAPGTSIPQWDEVELDIPPEAVQAAQFLAELLLSN